MREKLMKPSIGKIMALDTSTASMVLAVLDNGTLLAEYHLRAERSHSVHLIPDMQKLLQSINLTVEDINCIAVGQGPGSYTGVRIGITVAKTMAWALKIPLIAVSSLEALAYGGMKLNHQSPGYSGMKHLYEVEPLAQQWIVPLMDARRGQVYTGLYASSNKADETGAVDVDVVADASANVSASANVGAGTSANANANGGVITDNGTHSDIIAAFDTWSCIVSDQLKMLDEWIDELAVKAIEMEPASIVFVGETGPFMELQSEQLASELEMRIEQHVKHRNNLEHLPQLGQQIEQQHGQQYGKQIDHLDEPYKENGNELVSVLQHDLRAAHVGELAYRNGCSGDTADVYGLVPNYTQLSEAEAKFKTKMLNQKKP